MPTPERRDHLEEVQRLDDAVRRVGVNVNQVARRVNLAPDQVAAILAGKDVLPVLKETRELLHQVLAVLEDLRPRLRRGVTR